MAPAYVVATYNITNPEAFEAYTPAVMPTLAGRDAEVLVADRHTEGKEGDPLSVTIVIRFPSKEAANDWYHSPEYQAVIHLRTDNSEGNLVIADGFVPPS